MHARPPSKQSESKRISIIHEPGVDGVVVAGHPVNVFLRPLLAALDPVVAAQGGSVVRFELDDLQ